MNKGAKMSEVIFQEESKDLVLSNRFEKMVHAIEFFSQRFSLENITNYIFEFTQKLIEVEECDVYALDGNTYYLMHSRTKTVGEDFFPKEEKHDQSVYFHAGLMEYDFLLTMVPKKYIGTNIRYAIPLIMDKSLFGMVLIGTLVQPDRNDYIVSEALMNLFSLSLTNYENYEKLDRAKVQLDAKVFNLFAINQASKALLSVLDIQELAGLSLSVFSELTQSRVTAMFLLDELSGQYRCEGVIDVFNKVRMIPMNIRRNSNIKKEIQIVVDCNESQVMTDFQEAFSDEINLLNRFEPQYIVNLVNEGKLLGFVTLAKKVNHEAYEKDIFELIESLASATYIAVSNAKHLQEIAYQQKVIREKFERLQRINRLIKNMNSATHVQNLMELTLETIRMSFGYKTGFFALFQKETQEFTIEHTLNLSLRKNMFTLESDLADLQQGKMIIEYHPDDIENLFIDIFEEEEFEFQQGLLMIPITIEDVEQELIGVIALLDVEKGSLVTEENIITLETIANHIAPVVKQLKLVEETEKKYEKNMRLAFRNQLRESMEEVEYSQSGFYIVGIKAKKIELFDSEFLSRIYKTYHYSFGIDNNHAFIFAYTKEEAMRIVKEQEAIHSSMIMEYPFDVENEEEIMKKMSNFIYGEQNERS